MRDSNLGSPRKEYQTIPLIYVNNKMPKEL